MLLALNLLLAGGGIALFNGYLDKREQAAHASGGESPEATDEGQASESESEKPPTDSDSVPPTPVKPVTGDNVAKTLDAGATAPGPNTEGSSPTPSPGPSTPTPTPTPTPDPVATRAVDAGLSAPPRRGADAGRRRPKNDKPPTPTPEPEPEPEPPGEDEGKRVQVLASKISLVVSRHQGQLTRCYQSAAKVNPPGQPLEGRIRLQFSIHPDGKARSIGVVSDDTGSRALAKCLVGLVGSWTFPSSGSDALDFVWPFDFEAPQ